MSPRSICLAFAAALFAAPTLAHATVADALPFGFIEVASHAAPAQQILMLCLVLATAAAIVVAVLKLLPGRLSGGSTFVSSLRLAGPTAGVLGAAYAALKMSIGIASTNYTPTLKVLAPGFAEIATVFALGLISGIIAIILTWAIEARIDRQVLAS